MIVVGAGCSKGCGAEELLTLIDRALADAGLRAADVTALATADIKAREPGLLAAAHRRGWPILTHAAAALAEIRVPTPSAVVLSHVGTASVAEAAALASAAPATLLIPKRRSAHATCAIARQDPPS